MGLVALGMWDPPAPGIELVSTALEGRFFTTEPPGKPYLRFLSGIRLPFLRHWIWCDFSTLINVLILNGLPWWLSDKKICLPMQEMWVWSQGWEDILVKEMATHCSILAWEIPWTEGPGGLYSLGSIKSQTWVSKETVTILNCSAVPDMKHTCFCTSLLHFWNRFFNIVFRILASVFIDTLLSFTAAKLLSHFSPTLCDPIDGSPPGSPVPGILQARTLEWVGCHFLLQCRKVKSESEVAQSCLTLSDSMDYSPPGSSVHGIFQARVLEWGAIAFSDSLFQKCLIEFFSKII